MTTHLIPLPHHSPGTVSLKVTGPAVGAFDRLDDLHIAIVQPGATERYLDPRNPDEPWTTSVYRFRPLAPRLEGNALLCDIEYGVTYHLRANQPYKLRLRQAGGAETEEVFTVPATLKRPTTRPTGWTPPPDPRGPVTVPPPVPAPLPAKVEAAGGDTAPPPTVEDPLPEPGRPQGDEGPKGGTVPSTSASSSDQGTDPTPSPKKWLVPALAALLLAGGGAAYLLLAGGTAPVAETMDSCRKILAGNPEPAAARTKADGLAKERKLLDCQFLLYKYAGEKGDRDAARVLGTFYDPDTWSKDKSPLPAPNPTEAAHWHKQAAEAGDVESQYRYGMLLKLGRTEEADGPEQAQTWLSKAADAGHPLAKEALGK
jgi:hypothetical protein